MVIGLDLGEETGLVVVREEDGEVLFAKTLHWEDVVSELSSFDFLPSAIVVERPPGVGAWKDLLHSLTFYGKVVQISPGEWKAFTPLQSIRLPKKLSTRHEKDAYRMVLYYLIQQGG